MSTPLNSIRQAEAERWFARRQAPDFTREEQTEFERWQSEDPAHAVAYEQTSELWERLGELADDPDIASQAREALEETDARYDARADVQIGARADARRTQLRRAAKPFGWGARRDWVQPVALAATLVMVAVAGWVLLPQKPAGGPGFSGPGLAFSTKAGEQRTIPLADGSVAQLDVDSGITVKYDRAQRVVTVDRGRVLFNVQHDANRPFEVDLPGGIVRDLGTRFVIERQPQSSEVTVLEGSVSAESGRSRRALSPGEQVEITGQDNSALDVRKVSPEDIGSWAAGRLVFHSRPLAEVVREVNRYAPRKLRLGSPALAGLGFSGSFKLGDSESVARALPVVLPVEVVSGAGDLVVMPR